MANKLTPDQIQNELQSLAGWSLANEKLHKTFQFPDFAHAFGFMATAAIEIDKRNHHPEWLNVYNRVIVDLTTHDAGGITGKDIDLAKLLNQIAAKLQ